MSKPVKVIIHPRPEGEKMDVRSMTIEEILESAGADWDPEDPGVGKTVLLPDGREIFNPVAMAPPIGFREEPDIMALMFQRLRAELKREVAEDDPMKATIREVAEDWPEDRELDGFLSPYQVIMMTEFPEMVPVPPEKGGPDLPPTPLEEAIAKAPPAPPDEPDKA